MSANIGGYLRGPWWKYNEDAEKTRRCFVIAWGNIVKVPKESYKDIRSVKFAIKTGRGAGRNEKYLVCVARGETIPSVVMRALELGDIVLVCGTWVEYETRTKKGIKPTYEAHINFILPLGLVRFLLTLYASPRAQEMVDEVENAEPDVWESDFDDLDC